MSDGKIIKLFEDPMGVKNLEYLIEQIKSGEVVGVVMIATTRDSCVITGHTGVDDCPYTVLGALSSLSIEINDKYIEKEHG